MKRARNIFGKRALAAREGRAARRRRGRPHAAGAGRQRRRQACGGGRTLSARARSPGRRGSSRGVDAHARPRLATSFATLKEIGACSLARHSSWRSAPADRSLERSSSSNATHRRDARAVADSMRGDSRSGRDRERQIVDATVHKAKGRCAQFRRRHCRLPSTAAHTVRSPPKAKRRREVRTGRQRRYQRRDKAPPGKASATTRTSARSRRGRSRRGC